MNLIQLNELLEYLTLNNSDNTNTELINFYTRKKKELLKEINNTIRTKLNSL